MSLAIRLQNHGYRNHPYWYIVVIPKNKNPQGKYVEQIGYWIPRRGKTFQRSIIINRHRAQYWLAMGAQPSQKVEKFLNMYDLWPNPVVKFGSKSIYERPEKQIKDNYNLNPYTLGPFKQFMGKVLEQEETSYVFRQLFLNQNLTQYFENQKFTTQMIEQSRQNLTQEKSQEELQNEISDLKNELKLLQNTQQKLDQTRQHLLIKRINELYNVWQKQKLREEYKQLYQQGQYSTEINENNLKQHLDMEKFSKKMQDFESLSQEYQDRYKPITREEFRAYLLANGNFPEAKVETLIRQTFRNAKEKDIPVYRQDAIDLCNPERPIQNVSEVFIKKYQNPDDKIFIPITKPITPIPDIKSYDPEDYYEIPKMHDPIQLQNKSFDLPNINDVHIPKKAVKTRTTPKNSSGRKHAGKFKTKLYDTYIKVAKFSTQQNNNNNLKFNITCNVYQPLITMNSQLFMSQLK